MNLRRREFIAGLGGAAAWPLSNGTRAGIRREAAERTAAPIVKRARPHILVIVSSRNLLRKPC
jgi:hypothetical protein